MGLMLAPPPGAWTWFLSAQVTRSVIPVLVTGHGSTRKAILVDTGSDTLTITARKADELAAALGKAKLEPRIRT